MEVGPALAIAAGVIVLAVIVTKKQEQKTAAMAARIKSQIDSQGLSLGDAFAIGGTAVATYAGGPAAGLKFASGSGLLR